MTDNTPAGRVARYLVEHGKMRSIDREEIHGLHIGDEREAVLTVSDLSAILAQREALLEALKDACDEIRDLRRYANNRGGMIDEENFVEGLAAIALATGEGA